MAVRFSEGLRNLMLGDTGLNGALTLGFLEIYTGVQPTSSNLPATGTKLLTISVSGLGTGLTFAAPASGIINKAAAEAWQGIGLADGVAGWARFISDTDGDLNSTTDARIDMSVAQTGGDLNLSNTTVVLDAPTTVDIFQLTMAES